MTNIIVAVTGGSTGAGSTGGASSPDGVTWTARSFPKFTSGADNTWRSVCFSPDLAIFCAVASGGSNNNNAVATSADGTTWTGGNIAGSAWRSVVWAGGSVQKFVAVGDAGAVATSPDGVTWTNRTAAEANNWVGVSWSATLGLFAAVSSGGTHQIMTSPDGVTWTVRAQPTGGGLPTSGMTCICWEDSLGVFCALYSNFGMFPIQSGDGITWTGFNPGVNFGNVDFIRPANGGGFVAGGHNGSIVFSALGRTSWTTKTTVPGSVSDAWDAIYDKSLGLYIIPTSSSTVVTTTDLVTDSANTVTQHMNLQSAASNNQLGNASSGNASASGVTLTATSSVISGEALLPAPGGTVTATTSLIPGAAHIGAISGGRIYEVVTQQSMSAIFQVSDYDSIYSRGDRVANGLLSGGQYGWSTVFSDGSQGFDNIFTGNGPAASGTTSGAAFWFSSVGGETLDIRGFRLIGEDAITSYANFWAFYGGTSPGNYSTLSYFKTIEGYNPNQGQTGTLATPQYEFTFQYTDYIDEPRFYSPWPHYEFVYISGPRPDVRWAEEIWLQIAHSSLDGGDRRPGHATASKAITLTFSADWSWSTTTGFVSPVDGLLDGMWEHESDKLANHLVKMGDAANFVNPVTTVGAWMQFQFPRPVIPKHLQFINFNGNKEVYSSGNPTKFGKWHWEYFDEATATWTVTGAQWWFRDNCVWMVAPHGIGTDFALGAIGPSGQGFSKWRMVLDAGPAFGSGFIEVQIQFDLVDTTGQAPPFEIHFTDDSDNVLPVPTIGSPGTPYVVKYSDGVDDGLTLILTNTPNPVLTVDFTDDGQFDTWSDLYPSIVVQTVLVTTGR